MLSLRFSRAALIVAVALTFASCSKKQDNPADKYNLSKKNNVVWWQLSDINRLHPYISNDANASYVSQYIWEPLNNVHPRTHELLPWLASLPVISEDHLTYTYTMDPAAKWSDGKPLTGEDVVFSFKALMNPAVVNSQSLRSYMNPLDSLSYVDGNKMVVRFHMQQPYFQNDRVLGAGYVPIMPKHIFDPKSLTDQITWSDLKKFNTKNKALTEWATWSESAEIARDPKYQIGCGPYLYKEWVTNSHITLTKNPNYWAKGRPWSEVYPDEIVYKTINDPNAAMTSLKRKDLDLMDAVPSPLFVQLDATKQPFIKKDTVFYDLNAWIAWNSKRPIFSNKRVRRALTHLIPKADIISKVLKGIPKPTDGPIVFTETHYVPPKEVIGYDPAKAKQILTEEGWTDSDGDGTLDKVINGRKTPFKFMFVVNSGSDINKQILVVISEAMKKVGIQADVSAVEWSVFLENYRGQNYDAAMAAIAGNAGEDDYYSQWHSSQAKGKGQNTTSLINPEVDKLLEDNKTEFDLAKRGALMARFQEIIREEQPVSWLWSSPLRIARIDRFDNVEFFRQRPGFAVPWWVVRGTGVKADPNQPSTMKSPRESLSNN